MLFTIFQQFTDFQMHLNASQHARQLKNASTPVIGRRAVSLWRVYAPGSQSASLLLARAPVRRSGCSLEKGKRLAEGNIGGAVLWTPGTMSRPGRRKTSRSYSTCQFQVKHRARRSRRNCRESLKTSTENCVGNTGRVSSLSGPLRFSVALQPMGWYC